MCRGSGGMYHSSTAVRVIHTSIYVCVLPCNNKECFSCLDLYLNCFVVSWFYVNCFFSVVLFI